jgi:uncharacterized protein (TIGR04255 family)
MIAKASTARRQYKHPPIIDAVIELRFTDDLTDEMKAKVASKLAPGYELSEELVSQHISVAVGAETVSTTATVADRIVRRTKFDRAQLVQLGNRILNVGGNAPYEGWESLFDRFKDAWEIAKSVWKFRAIERVGVRYINRLDLRPDQTGTVEYEDFLNLRINLPPQFPAISHYDLSFRTRIPDINCGATVSSGAAPPAVPGRISFLLDVDVWRETEVPQKQDAVYALLGEMREAKNNLFELFVTDKARESFDAA